MSDSCRVRVALFGSFYRGFFVLSELLNGPLKDRIQVVGVATDDPHAAFVNARARLWQYPHTPEERTMVENLARLAEIPVYSGRINSDPFHSEFRDAWKPDLCIMATFGQRIPARLFELPRLGFYNLHPCTDDGWPSRYAGGNPFAAMAAQREPWVRIALHRVDSGFDTGELIAYSEPVAYPPNANVIDMHKLTAVTAARLACRHIESLLVPGSGE